MAGKAKINHRGVDTTEMMGRSADENAFTFLLRACRVPVRHRRGRPPCKTKPICWRANRG